MKEHFHAGTIEGLGLTDYDCGVIAAGALMQYLVETQKRDLSHISHLTIYASGKIYAFGQLNQTKSGAV